MSDLIEKLDWLMAHDEAAYDIDLQERLLATCADLTGITMGA